MSMIDAWSDAIGLTADEAGAPSVATVVEHVRAAVIEAGFVSRGRITSGLKEAYRPLGVDAALMRQRMDAAIHLMLLSGDLEEHATSAGRGYAGTPSRLIHWDGDRVSLLGTSNDGIGLVRQFPADAPPNDVVRIPLADELGRPEWRNALVELGAADAPNGDARALFAFSQALAASGERYSLDEPNAVAVVSGRADFFGRADPAPSGRWRRVEADGCYPAAIRTGYTLKNVVLHVAGKDTTLWQPSSRDIWRWIVVGQTLALGDPVLRYDQASGVLDFLTPPPRQAERAALIAGEQQAPWSWKLDSSAHAVIAALMGCLR
ncbi:hypothetical protein [Brevundimonas aurifodinae]|uniref:Uncharacterized protein n=1 Tax=Brevundimonas aurifodinae TaxID=1508312 RepID=A0ABV1NN96_9CAUL